MLPVGTASVTTISADLPDDTQESLKYGGLLSLQRTSLIKLGHFAAESPLQR